MDALRLQIAVDNVLQAEVIAADYSTLDRLWARYACAKHKAGKEAGGAIIQRADLPRTWDVAIGAEIPVSICAWCSDAMARTEAATAEGRIVTHGICQTHRAEFEAGR